MFKPTAIVELVWQDASGSTSATTVFAPSSLTVSAIDASASALASLLLPLTGCVLVAQRIKYVWVPDEPVVASGENLLTHTGVLFFSIDGSASGGLVVIHAIDDSVFVSDGPGAGAVIDLANTDIAALVSAVLDAGFCNPFAAPFLDVSGGYLQSRL